MKKSPSVQNTDSVLPSTPGVIAPVSIHEKTAGPQGRYGRFGEQKIYCPYRHQPAAPLRRRVGNLVTLR
jgi:hypothetical protein